MDNARVSGIQVRKIGEVTSDSDGIPDWWRLGYFGHALGQASDLSRASDDADGDGVSNLTEFLAGTDPLNPASSPPAPACAITRIALAGAQVQITCSTATNWTYRLQRCDSLTAPPAWTNVGPTIAGTNGTMLLSDPSGATNIARYYRVQAR